jgi:hypothetical protein
MEYGAKIQKVTIVAKNRTSDSAFEKYSPPTPITGVFSLLFRIGGEFYEGSTCNAYNRAPFKSV